MVHVPIFQYTPDQLTKPHTHQPTQTAYSPPMDGIVVGACWCRQVAAWMLGEVSGTMVRSVVSELSTMMMTVHALLLLRHNDDESW